MPIKKKKYQSVAVQFVRSSSLVLLLSNCAINTANKSFSFSKNPYLGRWLSSTVTSIIFVATIKTTIKLNIPRNPIKSIDRKISDFREMKERENLKSGDTYGKLSRSAPSARSPTFSRAGGLDEVRSRSVLHWWWRVKGVFGCSQRSELNQGLFTNAPRLAGRPLYIGARRRVVATRRKLRDLRPRPCSASSHNAQFPAIDCFGSCRRPGRTGTATIGIASTRSVDRCVDRCVFLTPWPGNQQMPKYWSVPGRQGRRDFWHVRSARPGIPPHHPTHTDENAAVLPHRPRCH